MSDEKSLLDIVRTLNPTTMDKYSIIFNNKLKEENEIYFHKIDDGEVFGQTISARKFHRSSTVKIITHINTKPWSIVIGYFMKKTLSSGCIWRYPVVFLEKKLNT